MGLILVGYHYINNGMYCINIVGNCINGYENKYYSFNEPDTERLQKDLSNCSNCYEFDVTSYE